MARSSYLAALCSKLKASVSAIGLGLVMMLLSLNAASAETLKTNYFSVDLGSTWAIAGTPHNMEHSVNVNFINRNAGSSINVVVGAGTHKPFTLLTNLQQALHAQGAHTKAIQQYGSVLYFEFNIGPIQGFACSNSNNKDTMSITVMGNPQVGVQFIHSFYDTDPTLFPNFMAAVAKK